MRARKAREVSIKLGNAMGSGAALFGKLKDAEVNVVASCCYQIDNDAHFSIVADDVTEAEKVLRDNGFSPTGQDVLLIDVPNEPGALATVLQECAKLGVDVTSAYATTTIKDSALVVIKTTDDDRVLQELKRPAD